STPGAWSPGWGRCTTGSSGRGATFARVSTRATASWRRDSPSGSSSSTAPDQPTSSRRRCMERFADVPEQPDAKRLLAAPLDDGPAHAYLLHGPAGVGKKSAAF